MGRPVTLVFLIDALGWEIADAFDFGRDRFSARAPLDTVLGYSSAAIPSLLSGTPPSEHGAWAMFRRAGDAGSFSSLRWVPRLPHALDWRARRWIRRWLDRRGRVRSYYDLYEIPAHLLHRFDLGQFGDPFLPGGLARETVFDWMRARPLRYRLWYYPSGEDQNLREAEAALSGRDDVLFVYTAELDALMHRVGIFHDEVRARLARYRAFLDAMARAARVHDVDLEVVVLSDHGMTDVTDTVDVWGTMERRGLRVGREYLAFYDSTMARLWSGGRAVEAMSAALAGRGRRLDAAELRGLGCHFPDGRYGEEIYLADPGVLIVPSFMGSRRIAAMHGYHPHDRFSRGVFMTTSARPAPASIVGFKAFFEAVAGRA